MSNRIDLLKLRPLRAIAGSKYFPIVPQLLALCAYVAIILKSPLGEEIGPVGKLTLVLSATSYVASFYIPV